VLKSTYPNIKYAKTDIPMEVIPAGMFARLTNLEAVELPATVREIGTGAFADCFNLKQISIPSNLKVIGTSAFSACHSLTEFKVPGGQPLESIGSYAFSDSGLRNLSGAHIGMSAFEGCLNLEEINLDWQGTQIGLSIFEGCTNLKRVNLNLLGATMLPWGLYDGGKDLFKGCKSLEEATLTMEIIPKNIFHDCFNLKRVTLGEGTKEVQEHAFPYCNITDIYLPSTMRNFHVNAFIRESGEFGDIPLPVCRNVHAKDLDSFLKLRP